MKILKALVITQIIIICCVNFILAQTLIQQLNAKGEVDWKRFVVRASGSSSISHKESTASQKIQALENAKISAEKNLLIAVKAIRVNANSTIQDLIKNKGLSPTQIANVVKQFIIVDTRSMSDMSVEIDVELPILGQISSLILPKKMGTGQLILSEQPLCPTCWQPWPEGKPVPEGTNLIIPSKGFTTDTGEPFTGLVIDARGLNVNPSILPEILNEDNQEIYGTNFVTRKSAVEFGMVSYKTDLKEALIDRRVSSKPLQIKALNVAGNLRSNIIISNSDAILIHAAAKTHNFLRDCRVIIVIG